MQGKQPEIYFTQSTLGAERQLESNTKRQVVRVNTNWGKTEKPEGERRLNVFLRFYEALGIHVIFYKL